MADGCGPAQGRSGFAENCRRRHHHRHARFRRLVRELTGLDLTLDYMLLALHTRHGHPRKVTLQAVRALLAAFADGRLAFYPVPKPGKKLAGELTPG